MAHDRDKRLISHRFGRQADVYESVTPVQRLMADHLTEMITSAFSKTAPATVLDLGCGTGRLTRRLADRYRNASVIGVDLAPGMVEKARDTVPTGDFVVADAERFLRECSNTFDVIASNAALQWFEHPVDSLRRCMALLNPGGILAVATFGDGTFKELRESFELAYQDLGREPSKHVHKMPTADYWREALPEFSVEETPHELVFPSVREFLRSVQMAGATHSPTGCSHLSHSAYRAMSKRYQENFSTQEGIVATYHAIYLRGKK